MAAAVLVMLTGASGGSKEALRVPLECHVHIVGVVAERAPQSVVTNSAGKRVAAAEPATGISQDRVFLADDHRAAAGDRNLRAAQRRRPGHAGVARAGAVDGDQVDRGALKRQVADDAQLAAGRCPACPAAAWRRNGWSP